MFVTAMPISSKTYYCSPKANHTSPLIVTKRVLQLISGFGLSINGKHTYCGDYIYSGHTVMLVLNYLIIKECEFVRRNTLKMSFFRNKISYSIFIDSPKRCQPINWLAGLIASTGVIMVLLAHSHYTVDVLIAYYITTRLWYIYHTMANVPQLKVSLLQSIFANYY